MSGSLSPNRYVELRKRRDDAYDVGAWLGAIGAPVDVIAAQERVLQAIETVSGEIDVSAVRRVVDRYGRVWVKDEDYYTAAEALGIKEPPDPCIEAGRHVCGPPTGSA